MLPDVLELLDAPELAAVLDPVAVVLDPVAAVPDPVALDPVALDPVAAALELVALLDEELFVGTAKTTTLFKNNMHRIFWAIIILM